MWQRRLRVCGMFLELAPASLWEFLLWKRADQSFSGKYCTSTAVVDTDSGSCKTRKVEQKIDTNPKSASLGSWITSWLDAENLERLCGQFGPLCRSNCIIARICEWFSSLRGHPATYWLHPCHFRTITQRRVTFSSMTVHLRSPPALPGWF